MKLYAQGLARRLHEQRIGAAKPAPPNTPAAPTSPANRQKPTVPNSGGGNGYHRPSPNRQKPTDPDTGHAPADRQKPTDPDTGGGGVTTFEPRVAHTVKPLTQAQLNAIDLLVLGHSDSSAANHLGIHRTTLSTWRTNHPAFRAELARRRQEVWGSACERFRNLLNKAVDELEKQLDRCAARVRTHRRR